MSVHILNRRWGNVLIERMENSKLESLFEMTKIGICFVWFGEFDVETNSTIS